LYQTYVVFLIVCIHHTYLSLQYEPGIFLNNFLVKVTIVIVVLCIELFSLCMLSKYMLVV